MSHISAPQQEGGPRSSEETIAPIFPLFTALKAAYIDNQQLLEKLDAFLQSEERKALAKLKDSTAEEAINLLDKLVGNQINSRHKLRPRTMRVLRSLSGSLGVLPASYALQEEVAVPSGSPYAHGSHGLVWCSTMGGEKVAIKVIKVTNDPKRFKRQLSKEAVIWKHLKHRNILPLIGVSQINMNPGEKTPSFCLVSPWMEGGNICAFTIANPKFNRFKLLMDVCDGLIYLHSERFSHGDLKGDNVLIDGEHRALLADFGLARIEGVSNSSPPGGTMGYMPPELFKDNPTRPQEQPISVFSLGTLIHEVLSGQPPFRGKDRWTVRALTRAGAELGRPFWTLSPNHPIWVMVERCRATEPSQRPLLSDVSECLKHSSVDPPERWPSPPTSESSLDSPPRPRTSS